MNSQNTFKTALLLASLSGLLMLIGGLIGGNGGIVLAFALAVAMNLGSWWYSDALALRMSGAREVEAADLPGVHQMVERLAAKAEIPKPRVAVIDSPMPNAFAAGRSPERGVVAVTAGLLQRLSADELAGVIAHELAHIKNRDTLIAGIAATIAGAIAMLANIAQFSLFFGGGDDDDNPLGMLGLLLAIFVAPIAALIIQMAISRSREFEADAAGARILGRSEPLAQALIKLENWSKNPQAQAIAQQQVQAAAVHQYIVNPLHGGFSNLFRTHPSTEERVDRLRSLSL